LAGRATNHRTTASRRGSADVIKRPTKPLFARKFQLLNPKHCRAAESSFD